MKGLSIRKPIKIDLLKLITTLKKDYILKNLRFMRTVEYGIRNPMKVQERLLKKILEKNKDTIYGKKYGFSKIKSIEDFQEKVPIITYPDIKKYVERMKKGEQNILTKEKVIYFAETSGTTSEPKYIPVTKKRMRFFMKQLLMWGYFVARKNVKVLRGKTLYFAGTDVYGYTKSGIPRGAISGYILKNLPWYAKNRLALNPEVYDIEDFETRTNMMALVALQKNVTQIGFAEPIEAILFFDYLKNNKERLLRELRILGKRKLARQLEKKDFKPIKIWPQLTVVSCIKSHMNGMYLDKLVEKIGSKKVQIRDPGIYSSEGPITLCLSAKGSSGINLFNVNFFEFIEQDKEDAKPVTLDKLRKGKCYQVILTSQEGLYRYNLGDVVKVTGFKGKLPLLQFMHRSKFLDLAGEKSPEQEIINAVKDSAKEFCVEMRAFTVIPFIENLEKKPRYEILVETDASDSKIKKMLEKFDKNMQERVLDYGCMRNEYGRLDSPIVAKLKKGSYDKFEKKRIMNTGQPKLIQISKDPNFKKNFEIEKEFFI